MLLRILLLAPLAAFAQANLSAEWQKQYDAWYWPAQMSRPENVRWSESGRLLAYSWKEGPATAWKLVDCATGETKPAFDHQKTAAVLSVLTKRTVTSRKWPFTQIIPLDDGRIRLEADDAAWIIETSQRLTAVPTAAKLPASTQERTGRGPGDRENCLKNDPK